MNLQKTSMNEMRRKVHSMLNYVGQAQVEMASKKSFQVALDKVLLASGGAVKSIPANAKLTETPKDDVDKQKEKDKSTEKKEANELENSGASGGTNSAGSGSTSLKELMKGLDGFKELPTTEMMNMLSTRLVLWQQEYGKLGEK